MTQQHSFGMQFSRTIITRTKVLPVLAGLAATLAVGMQPAHAATSTPVETCGTVLAAPGKYHLTNDLGPCEGHGVEITASNVEFTLAGFTIAGQSTPDNCNRDNPQHGIFAQAPATNVHINGGKVTGFVDGIVLSASYSQVSAMTVQDNCVFGIAVQGIKNVIDTNEVTGSGTDGIILARASNALVTANHAHDNNRFGIGISEFSDGNTIRSNILRHNGLSIDAPQGGGVAVFNGNNNIIRGNAANENFDGIFLSVSISGTLIQDNTANGNMSVGIAIGSDGAENLVKNNTARNNGIIDLSDASPACGANTWRKNTFATDSVAGGPDSTNCIK